MKLKRLELTNFRTLERRTFHFEPGMNLIVGVNGSGKSSMLDALRIILFRALSKLDAYPGRVLLHNSDVTIGREDLTAELNFVMSGIPFLYTINGRKKKQSDDFRYVVGLKPDSRDILKFIEKSREDLLAVYFSPHRSLLTGKAPSTQASAGAPTAAFADALLRRPLRFREFAAWWVAQEKLSQEGDDISTRRLEILANSATRFLEGYTNLRAVRDPEITLLLDREGMTLDVRQLSDGERGLLALVFDLARRLSLANPKLDDPLRDGKAVVLIDELDLHLHPGWQRTVIEKLTTTFPNCQFIATTHSPQLIGEVSPDNIILLERGQPPYRPDQSLGMDSNWILRHLMDTNERDSKTEQELSRIAGSIEDEQYDKATAAIETLRTALGEFPELIRLQTRIDRIRLLGE